jgi:hypothetical protein
MLWFGTNNDIGIYFCQHLRYLVVTSR